MGKQQPSWLTSADELGSVGDFSDNIIIMDTHIYTHMAFKGQCVNKVNSLSILLYVIFITTLRCKCYHGGSIAWCLKAQTCKSDCVHSNPKCHLG